MVCRILFLLFFSAVLYGGEVQHRIVSLSPALTETLCRIGAERYLVGRSAVCNWPASVKKLPVAGNFGQAFIEPLILLKPTVVVSNAFAPGAKESIEKNGIKTVMIPIETIEDYRKALILCGKMFGLEKQAESAVKETDETLHELQKNVKNLKQKPSVAWIVWDTPVITAGTGSLPDTLISLSGARNVFGKGTRKYFTCSTEKLMMNDPDVLIWTASPVSLEQLKKHAFWKNFRAVRQGNVLLAQNEDALIRPGPRVFEGIRKLQDFLEKTNIPRIKPAE